MRKVVANLPVLFEPEGVWRQVCKVSCTCCFFFFSSRRRHTRLQGDWSSDVCSSDLQKSIRQSFFDMALPGAWRVVVKPSCVNGRWDFSIHGLDVRHTLSIAVPPNLLDRKSVV